MSKVVLNQIIDGVYFQKLSSVLTNIQQWQKNKNNIVSSVYEDSVFSILHKLLKNGKEFSNQMTEFLKILNLQYSFLSKLKKDEKNVQISSFYNEFKVFGNNFNVIKDSLLQLVDYLGKFIGVTGYQFTEIKKIYDQVEQLNSKFQIYRNKAVQNFNHKKDLIYSKRNIKKTFQITRILDMIKDLCKEQAYYNDLSEKLGKLYERELDNKEKMYQDISDNLEFISKLYQNSFKEELLASIRIFFAEKLKICSINERQILQRSKIDLNLVTKAFQKIEEMFYGYFDTFLNEITIANWSIIFSVKVKENDEKVEKQNEAIISLTFDNKVILFSLNKKEIFYEVNLEDVKIYKPDSDGKFEVKFRKSKQKIFLKFMKVSHQDQFFLHYQQIALRL